MEGYSATRLKRTRGKQPVLNKEKRRGPWGAPARGLPGDIPPPPPTAHQAPQLQVRESTVTGSRVLHPRSPSQQHHGADIGAQKSREIRHPRFSQVCRSKEPACYSLCGAEPDTTAVISQEHGAAEKSKGRLLLQLPLLPEMLSSHSQELPPEL